MEDRETISEVVKGYAAIGDVIEVRQSYFPQYGFDNEFLVVNENVQTISTYRKKKEAFLKEAKESGANVIAYGIIIDNAAIVEKANIYAGQDKQISKIIQSHYNIPSFSNILLDVNIPPFIVFIYERTETGGKLTCIGKDRSF